MPGDIVFRNLRLDSARVALATVRTISPTVALHGDLEGRGTLEGPWQNATFTGDFAHRRDGFANSYASGWIRLDVRRDTVGAFGSLRLDSLQLLTLATAVEDHFLICLNEDDEQSIATVGDLLGLIERKTTAAQSA